MLLRSRHLSMRPTKISLRACRPSSEAACGSAANPSIERRRGLMQVGELSAILVGRRVTDRQLAGNSFSIWLDTEKGRLTGWTIWLEPTWNLVGPDGVIAGSRQAQD